jgi:hypothetical protein
MQVIARIRQVFEVAVPILSVFENPKFAALEDEVEKARENDTPANAPIFPRSNAVDAETNKRTILAQLNDLSETELQEMLQQLPKDKRLSYRRPTTAL